METETILGDETTPILGQQEWPFTNRSNQLKRPGHLDAACGNLGWGVFLGLGESQSRLPNWI